MERGLRKCIDDADRQAADMGIKGAGKSWWHDETRATWT